MKGKFIDVIQISPLRPCDRTACLCLRIHPQQRYFVHSVSYSLQEAGRLSSDTLLLGIFRRYTLVGFIMLVYHSSPDDAPDSGSYEIARFLIGRQYQGRGYGTQALQALLEMICRRPMGPASHVWLSCNIHNDIGWKLYSQAGFQRQNDWREEYQEQIAIWLLPN